MPTDREYFAEIVRLESLARREVDGLRRKAAFQRLLEFKAMSSHERRKARYREKRRRERARQRSLVKERLARLTPEERARVDLAKKQRREEGYRKSAATLRRKVQEGTGVSVSPLAREQESTLAMLSSTSVNS